MSLIEKIKADREKGHDGPWHLHGCESFDGRTTTYYSEVWTENLEVIAAEVYRAHNDGGDANMRRISRVPEMEAALLAAEELAKALTLVAKRCGPNADDGKQAAVALAAYREAIA